MGPIGVRFAFSVAAALGFAVLPLNALAGGLQVKDFEGMPVKAVASGASASNLAAQAECTGTYPNRGVAKLKWSIAQPRGTEQRVLVSIYGFREGRFEATPPLPPDQTEYTWDRIQGQSVHSWMVLTRRGNAWEASPQETFDGPGCVADMRTGALR